MEVWHAVAASAVSLLVGILIGRVFFSAKNKAEKELEDTKNELGQLRSKMKEHLTETAFLFQQFDQQYQKLLKRFGDMSKDMAKSSHTSSSSHNDKSISFVEQPKDYEDKN